MLALTASVCVALIVNEGPEADDHPDSVHISERRTHTQTQGWLRRSDSTQQLLSHVSVSTTFLIKPSAVELIQRNQSESRGKWKSFFCACFSAVDLWKAAASAFQSISQGFWHHCHSEWELCCSEVFELDSNSDSNSESGIRHLLCQPKSCWGFEVWTLIFNQIFVSVKSILWIEFSLRFTEVWDSFAVCKLYNS